jgi:hypothetical protein
MESEPNLDIVVKSSDFINSQITLGMHGSYDSDNAPYNFGLDGGIFLSDETTQNCITLHINPSKPCDKGIKD